MGPRSEHTTNIPSDVMAVTSVWIGLAEVKPRDDMGLLDGALGAYVSIVALAESGDDLVAKAKAFLEDMGFEVVETEDVEPLQNRMDNVPPEEAILSLVDGLTEEDPVAVSTFDAYVAE